VPRPCVGSAVIWCRRRCNSEPARSRTFDWYFTAVRSCAG